MPKKLFITNERMLKLVDWALQEGVAESESDYFDKIGFSRTNIRNVRIGTLSFTKEHIQAACELTGASADWIFGFSNVMMRKKPVRAIELLKEAVAAVETELGNKNTKMKKVS